MHCLEEIRLSFRTKEYLEHPEREPAEEPLLRTLSQGPGIKSAKSTKVIILFFSWPCVVLLMDFPAYRYDMLTVIPHSLSITITPLVMILTSLFSFFFHSAIYHISCRILLLLLLIPAPSAKISTSARFWFDVMLLGNFADTNVMGSVCSPLVSLFCFGRGSVGVVEMAIYDNS